MPRNLAGCDPHPVKFMQSLHRTRPVRGADFKGKSCLDTLGPNIERLEFSAKLIPATTAGLGKDFVLEPHPDAAAHPQRVTSPKGKRTDPLLPVEQVKSPFWRPGQFRRRLPVDDPWPGSLDVEQSDRHAVQHGSPQVEYLLGRHTPLRCRGEVSGGWHHPHDDFVWECSIHVSSSRRLESFRLACLEGSVHPEFLQTAILTKRRRSTPTAAEISELVWRQYTERCQPSGRA